MRHKFLLINILTVITLFISFNSFSQIVKYSNDFLTIGVSAKSIGMGNSSVACVNDATSGYINPAGLSKLAKKYEVDLMHSEYFAGIAKYDYMSVSYKINDSSVFSASLIRLGVDDIQNTLNIYDQNGNIDFDRVELFSVADYAMLLSYGKKSKIKGLSYGINTKLIYRNQGQFANAYGFGADVGMQYVIKKWHFGVMTKDITTTFNAWFYNISDDMRDVFIATDNELPTNSLEITMPSLYTGVARYFKISPKIGFTSELDFNFTFDGERNALISFNPVSIYPQAGFDFNYNKIIFLRMGVNNFQNIPDFRNLKDEEETDFFRDNTFNFIPTLGLGIKLFNFSIDYALTDVGNQSIALYSNIFSLKYEF